MIRIEKLSDTPREEILARPEIRADVAPAVREIIADVRARGDRALLEYGRKFDCPTLNTLKVTAEEIDRAFETLDPALLGTLKLAEQNIREFHQNQLRPGFVLTRADGAVMGQRVLPIERVGIYVPGGTAAYPSTVLMNAVPAKLAGCKEIVMVTPCGRDGRVSDAILAAARLAGVTQIFKMGGAQAIAALAYGSESVPAVYKIVGPGNAYVAEAKRQVFGHVAIDMIAGPSEILCLADRTADARLVAADLLSQAEHDKLATAVLVTDCAELAQRTAAEIERQLKLLPREEIARASIENNGKIIVCENLDEVIDIANALAPEHLELCVQSPFDLLGRIQNAGSVFLGHSCPEALGDYLAGPNHTLPTMGTARFASPLSVDDFVKKMQYSYYTRAALKGVKDDIARFADAEGLHAHAQSALARFEGDENA